MPLPTSIPLQFLPCRRSNEPNKCILKLSLAVHGRGGRWIDNRMIERLWLSLEYECVYLNAFETGSETRHGIGAWIAYYNDRRPHSSHGLLTPDEAYGIRTPNLKIAA